MKKRLKLITSIMLCCLSLASLCFGVWAAVSVSLNISGTISYEINEVFVKVETNLYRSKNVAPLTDEELSTDITSFSTEAISENLELVSGFEMADVITYSPTEGIVSMGEIITSEVKNLALKYGAYSADEATTGYAFYLVFNITNYSTNAINVQITNNSDAEFLEVNNVTGLSPSIISGRGESESITVAKVVSMSPADFTTGFSSMQFNFSIAINNGALLENTESGYYYMYMGEYNGTPVEWRLVSTDGGATRYTYTAGKAGTISGDCVFVQNTYTKAMNFTPSASYKKATADDATNYPGIVENNYYVLDENGAFIALSETTGEDGVTTKEYALANNYEYSAIREYVTGDMVSDLGLQDDGIYNSISKNTDIYGDKLWLLSDTEANTLFSDNSDRIFYNGTSATHWWLRSPYSSSTNYPNYVNKVGDTNYGILFISYGVRAAFKIAL